MAKQEIDLAAISALLPNNYSFEVLTCDVGTVEKFTAVIRVDLKNVNDVKSWVLDFGKAMNCNFVLNQSKSQKKATVYRTYLCSLSSKNKTRSIASSSTRPDLSQRNFGCTASIAIWIDGDDFASKGLRGKIEIKWEHNHRLNTAHFLSLLRPLREVKDKFEEYFCQEHSINSAIAENEKAFESMDRSEAAKLRASKAYNQNRNVISHW